MGSSFTENYRPALCFTGLVTFIAMYHYFRIFQSFEHAYTPCAVTQNTCTTANGLTTGCNIINPYDCSRDDYGYNPTGHGFNDAYRYVDWFLTVPLLLIEIVLVMRLSGEETFSRCCTLGVSSGLMILNGYPGETSGDPSTRWCFWFLSMLPFTYIVYTLFVGLKESQEAQPEACKDQVKWACWATVFSWCTYPIVFIKVGYTVSDIISKCGVGYLVYRIGLAKSTAENGGYDKAENAEVGV